MATSPFTEEVTKMIEENTIWKSTKDVTKFGEILFQRKIWSFYWLNLVNLLNSSGNWLLISIQVIKKKNVTEWFQQQKSF